MTQEFKDSLINAGFNNSVPCQCCGSEVTVYKRRLNKGQVLFLYELAFLYRKNNQPYHFYQTVKDAVKTKYNRHCTDYTKLVDFGLIAPIKEKAIDGNSTGFFCPTKRGMLFVDDIHKVPEYLIQHSNGTTLGESSTMVGIRDFMTIEDFKFNLDVIFETPIK